MVRCNYFSGPIRIVLKVSDANFLPLNDAPVRDGYNRVFARWFFRRPPTHNQFRTDDERRGDNGGGGDNTARNNPAAYACQSPRERWPSACESLLLRAPLVCSPPSDARQIVVVVVCRRRSRNRRRCVRVSGPLRSVVRVFPPSSIRAYFYLSCRTISPGRFRGGKTKKNTSPPS